MFAVDYPLLDIFISTLYLAVFIFWMILVFHIVTDIFRSHDLGGGMKAFWVLFILILPLVGGLVYLITRGGAMHERDIRQLEIQQKAFEDYIRKVANSKE